MRASLEEKLSLLPMDPGCYLMKDRTGTIIYVGKAKHLKNRVSSYFVGAHDHKTTKMVSLVVDFDIIVTGTEKESLILEINLIKEHRPRFNILFMDDKSYPYLKINRDGIPNVVVSRDRKHSPKFLYFGPYPNARAARNMASLLSETMPTKEGFAPNKNKIYTLLNKTDAPLSKDEVEAWRQSLIRVLRGNDREFRLALESKMLEASAALNFELAQLYKEKLDALNYIEETQQVQFNERENFDMFNYATHRGYMAIVGLFVRGGRLLEKTMALESTLEDPKDGFVSFIAQFYENQPLPHKVYIPSDIEGLDEILETEVVIPKRGSKRSLMEIGYRNAQLQLEDQFELLLHKESALQESLDQLRDVVGLDRDIFRIEMFDNSHISGSFAVSACVVFDDGLPNKDLYRRYKLSTGSDDVAGMREVSYRRYVRFLKEKTPFPDLIVVDGGITQLNAVAEVLRSLNIDVKLVGFVKDDHHRTRGILLEDGSLVEVAVNEPLYPLLAKMQEEVHRFVITYHKSLRKKAMTRSILDEVEGLGPVSQKKLYKEFSSLKNMRSASVEELGAIIPVKVAERLYEILHVEWNDVDGKDS